ncbi:hypothetical protein BP6252_06332 [Coleophoma cylindrospora]|uniref:Mid2 domain-containing protein n=1 Tax=Coleophoma cylindrospora TaxID=1849047 RepID=A0A3D8RMM2_9HELO|nr:hypothetical protein BP6252_06332 [Coleophoma cylindrospora]
MYFSCSWRHVGLVALATQLLAQHHLVKASDCYYPNGDLSSDVTCGAASSGASVCCPSGSSCGDVTSGICTSTGNVTLRGSCTDQTWKDSNCPSLCAGVDLAGNAIVTQCSDSGLWCCGTDCCADASRLFTVVSRTTAASAASQSSGRSSVLSLPLQATGLSNTGGNKGTSHGPGTSNSPDDETHKPHHVAVAFITMITAGCLAIAGSAVLFFILYRRQGKEKRAEMDKQVAGDATGSERERGISFLGLTHLPTSHPPQYSESQENLVGKNNNISPLHWPEGWTEQRQRDISQPSSPLPLSPHSSWNIPSNLSYHSSTPVNNSPISELSSGPISYPSPVYQTPSQELAAARARSLASAPQSPIGPVSILEVSTSEPRTAEHAWGLSNAELRGSQSITEEVRRRSVGNRLSEFPLDVKSELP